MADDHLPRYPTGVVSRVYHEAQMKRMQDQIAALSVPPAPTPPARERLPDCDNMSPPQWTGHWRDWHRGHGCKLDPDAKPPEPTADAPPAPEPQCPRCGSDEFEELSVAVNDSAGTRTQRRRCDRCETDYDVPLTNLFEKSPAPEPNATPQGVYGSEVLCVQCAETFCPSRERLHFHHDGCPACSAEPDATPDEGTKPDVRAIVEALGFDPTNHHNALACPYCIPDEATRRKLQAQAATPDEGTALDDGLDEPWVMSGPNPVDCPRCGAVVWQKQRHIDWHRRQLENTTKAALRQDGARISGAQD